MRTLCCGIRSRDIAATNRHSLRKPAGKRCSNLICAVLAGLSAVFTANVL